MNSFAAEHDYAWDAIFGTFEIPSLKSRQGFGQGVHPQKSRHRSGRAGGGGSSAYGLVHNALLTHQAMVKIVRGGGVVSAGRLVGQFSYITRAGSLDLECCNDGVVYRGADGEEGYRAVRDDWSVDFAGMDPRMTAYTYHLAISYPKGTDPEAAQAAAREFAGRLTGGDYGDHYKCVLAHHGDTANPHTHIVVNRAGANGKTLHLSPYGVDIQMLRDLHVETAREVGVVLNATSRFSRGVDQRPRTLGRIHAERAGRRLEPRSGKVQSRARNWPFHGAARRGALENMSLKRAQAGCVEDYSRIAGALKIREQMAFAVGRSSRRLGEGPDEFWKMIETAVLRAKTMLVRGGTLERRRGMEQRHVEQISPEQAAVIDAEFKAINDDIRVFVEGMTKNGEGLENEAERSEFEATLSRMIRDYEPFMNEGTKTLFSKRLEWDHGDVARDDPDPVRQRRAALEDAVDPRRTSPLGEPPEIGDDPRGAAVKAVLSGADKEVASRFEKIGMNGELALSRIRNGADVDRETRRNWFERDVASYANARSLSDAQARKEVDAAYRDAATLYRDARSEIRGINRGFARDMAEDHRSVAPEQAVARTQTREQDGQAREASPSQSRSPKQENKKRPPLDLQKGVRGDIVAIGEEPYDPEDKESMSPYVDLKIDGYDLPRRLWGVGLPDMLERYRLDVGDTATIVQPGKETVTVDRRNKETGLREKVNVTRNQWDARDVDRAEDRDPETARKRERARREESRSIDR